MEIPSLRASSTRVTMRSVLFISLVRVAARKAAGKCALSQAVRTDRTA